MPRGACVVEYHGKRGVVFRIKYIDAAGEQQMETVGSEQDGCTRQKAERALGARLASVSDGYRRPAKVTFREFSDRFMDDYLPGRNLKPTTVESYRQTLDRHLLPALGDVALADVDAELLDRYVAGKIRGGLHPKTVTNHILLLNTMFKRAVKWRLISVNPVDAVDRPKGRHREMQVLTEAEVARLWTAYGELEQAAQDDEKPWYRMARLLTFTALGTALRRGELLGLRWRDVSLLEARLTVREAFVRGKFTTPKSDASRRSIDLGPRTVELLGEHWSTTPYQGDDELVFAHWQKGTPVDPSKVSGYMRTALAKAGITKPVRAFHDLRHSSLTHAAAAGNPGIYVQHRAGHSQASITERYLHAAQVVFPGAAEKAEARLFADLPAGVEKRVETTVDSTGAGNEKAPREQGFRE